MLQINYSKMVSLVEKCRAEIGHLQNIDVEYPYVKKDGTTIIKRDVLIKQGDNFPKGKDYTFEKSMLVKNNFNVYKCHYNQIR